MKITEAQRWKVLKLWSQVCKDRGWKPSDRNLRLTSIGKIINRELRTLDDLGRMDECTKVLKELEAMLGVNVDAGLEANDLTINKARTYRNVITSQILPCLALYEPDPPAYMRSVMEDKNRWWKIDRPQCGLTLDDLSAGPLKQLLMTLNARLHSKRKAARQTIHEMKIAAGVDCGCAECQKFVRFVRPSKPVLEPVAVDETQPF